MLCLELDQTFPRNTTIIIAAFGGWNDAAQSATDALEHLLDVWQTEELIDLPGDDYYDYQFNRPEVSIGVDGDREVAWPGTTIFKATTDVLPDTKIYLVHGVEPSMRWKQFCADIYQQLDLGESATLITLGKQPFDMDRVLKFAERSAFFVSDLSSLALSRLPRGPELVMVGDRQKLEPQNLAPRQCPQAQPIDPPEPADAHLDMIGHRGLLCI